MFTKHSKLHLIQGNLLTIPIRCYRCVTISIENFKRRSKVWIEIYAVRLMLFRANLDHPYWSRIQAERLHATL